MKVLIIALSILLSARSFATDYYVSSSGNDSNSGITAVSPWQSLTKVNARFSTLKPGDRILFKRGDTFSGTITISASGLPGSPITIGAFGAGRNPLISGFTQITGWINEGNGIYSKNVSVESPASLIIIDSVQYGMGRYPDSAYLIYESHSSNLSVTDNQLLSSPDWTGAEIVINKQNWLLDRCLITKHTGNIIEYNSYGSQAEPSNHRGYFIQNDLRTLDKYGEWYYDKSDGKLYMFFGEINPDTRSVKVAQYNNLIYDYTKNNIVVDGLSFEGSVSDAVNFAWGWGCIIKNCTVKFSGQSGMDIRGKNNIINNNRISYCNNAGIYTEGENFQIIQNEIMNIGLIPGSSANGNISEGIFAGGENSLIQYNTVLNVGRMGIKTGASYGTRIINNFINDFLLVLNDGGGIYVDGVSEQKRVIEGNIVLNGKGNSVGESPAACGIYLDENANDVLVRNNTVANNPYGINIHKANSNTIIYNLSFGNNVQFSLFNTAFTPAIYGNNINNNIFFAYERSSLVMLFNSKTEDIPGFGTADYNYYTRPVDEGEVIYTVSPLTREKYRTLSGWQLFSHQDANSHKSSITITDTSSIKFYYNPSKTSTLIPLAVPMVDIKGVKFKKSLTLEAYCAIVLMVDPDPGEIVPGKETLSVFPNPATDYIIVNIGELKIKPDFIRMNDLSGRIVYEDKINPGILELQIPVRQIHGLNVIQIGIKDSTFYSHKIIVTGH